MKTKGILLVTSLVMSLMGQSQIINPVQNDTHITGTVDHTGLAIAPDFHWSAIVYDDPGMSDYWIQWRDNTGAFLDINSQPGYNPDVAYYANPDALVVAYENGGNIFVDDYYYTGGFPLYNLFANHYISSGINPNVDINSLGNGVLTWEDGGFVFACTFNIGTFTAGPIVPIAPGTNPDIILLDTDDEVIITYEQGGGVMVESYLHWDLQSGGATLLNSHFMSPAASMIQLPRIASLRNSGFGGLDNFTVVAQEDLGGSQYLVWGWFFNSSGSFTPQKVNSELVSCPTFEPKPVVTYERDQVHIAWGQKYAAGCANIPVGGGSNLNVLMRRFDFWSNPIPPGVTDYERVNMLNSDFSNSATSVSSEYDGNYYITDANYCEAIVYSDPGDLFWKGRCSPMTSWKTGDEMEDPITIVKAPDLGQIKVTVEGMESESEAVTFTLVDNSGRQIQLSPATQSGNEFTLDASTLSNGIYLLNCTVGNRTKTERIAHFK